MSNPCKSTEHTGTGSQATQKEGLLLRGKWERKNLGSGKRKGIGVNKEEMGLKLQKIGRGISE